VNRYVVDASVIVASLLPDEPYHRPASHLLDKFHEGTVELYAVDLLPFEVANALWRAATRGRIDISLALEAIEQFEKFDIAYLKVGLEGLVKLAYEYGRTAYDAAYLALALQLGIPLLTADKRLFNALEGKFELIRWIDEVG